MANEISVSVELTLENDELATSVSKSKVLIDQTNAVLSDNTQTVTTVEAPMERGANGGSILGYCYLEHLGTSNTVELNESSGASLLALGPGECALFRFYSGADPQVLTDAGTASLRIVLLGD